MMENDGFADGVVDTERKKKAKDRRAGLQEGSSSMMLA